MTIEIQKHKTNRRFTGLSSDIKPTLTLEDVGDEFYVTDIPRLYIWYGASWDREETHTSPVGVPNSYNRVSTNSQQQGIEKGQLTKIGAYPRIGNEHAESSREAQAVVNATTIVGQVFRASRDNITALMLTLESAAGVPVDDFNSYVTDLDLQAVWTATGELATLNTINYVSSPNSMSIPTTTNGDSWEIVAAPTDYTDYTGQFDCYFSHDVAAQEIAIYLKDNIGNTKSLTISQAAANVWQQFTVNENAMVEDGAWTTDTTQIVGIGYRIITKRIGGTVLIDDLYSIEPAGDIDIRLHDMGTTQPVSGVTSIDSGTPYTKIGVALSASYRLNLEGGKRLYHIEDFMCGQDKSIPTNELININNYYIIELVYVDTDVTVYGPETGFTYDYYASGYAFTTPNEATAITAIGQYSDLMFGIMSAQDIYILTAAWKFNNSPNGNSQIAVFLEDVNMRVTDVIIDHENHPERIFTNDVSIRPMYLPSGGKLEYYYNDDLTDLVSEIHIEYQFLYEELPING